MHNAKATMRVSVSRLKSIPTKETIKKKKKNGIENAKRGKSKKMELTRLLVFFSPFHPFNS